MPQALAARYGLTAGTERKCSRGLWTKLSLDVTKSGQEPRPEPTPEQYTTSALDLILGNELVELVPPSEFSRDEVPGVERPFVVHLADIDIRAFQARYTRPVPKHPDGSFRLLPNKFILGITREHVTLPHSSKIAARVEGRSTLARLGLVVHLTAPTIHCGFDGVIVLEICNFGPGDMN